MDYPCTSCGECCKRLDLLHSLDFPNKAIADLVAQFPYELKEDGSCSQLNEDGTCNVYDHRPIICNIKYGIMLNHADETEYYKATADMCNSMIREAGLDESYLVKI